MTRATNAITPFALRAICAIVWIACLCGFAHVQDRLEVHGDGGAKLERRVQFKDWARWPAVTAPGSDAGREAKRRQDDTRQRICQTAEEAGWERCTMDEHGLTLGFSVGSDSPFSGTSKGTAYLAVDRLLGDARMRPMFKPMLLGIDSDQDRRTMRELRALDYRHTLEIVMPGALQDILGTRVDGRGETVRFDLMSETAPPEYRPFSDDNNFIHASAGFIHGRWTALLMLGAVGLILLFGIRRLRG